MSPSTQYPPARAAGPDAFPDLETFCRRRWSVFYPKTDLLLSADVLRSESGGQEAERARLVAEVCRRALAEEPVSVEPLSEQGTFHFLYRVGLAGDRSVIVRGNALGTVQRDYPLYVEAWVMGALRAAALPALRIYQVDVSRRWCPFDYAILEEARGTPLTAYDAEEERLRPLLRELGRTVARVHGIRTAGFGFLDVRPLVLGGSSAGPPRGIFACWRQYVLLNLDDHLRTCVAIGAVSAAEADRIEAAFAALDGVLDRVEPALLHGDLGSHNVFTDGRAITALIDWEDCLSGDPVFDLAFWATFHPDGRHPAFLDGYRSAATLPADFERRFWLYYLRVALSKTVQRHRFRLPDHPGRPPAARRIQKGLERVEALAGDWRGSV
jgi:aminoglycoside phosphotransferase (APT) family kinase protein